MSDAWPLWRLKDILRLEPNEGFVSNPRILFAFACVPERTVELVVHPAFKVGDVRREATKRLTLFHFPDRKPWEISRPYFSMLNDDEMLGDALPHPQPLYIVENRIYQTLDGRPAVVWEDELDARPIYGFNDFIRSRSINP